MKVLDAVTQWDLNAALVDNLIRNDIHSFFPVQCDVIPRLLSSNSSLCIEPTDLCVSAPTGSGKTLSYAIPIINTLLREKQQMMMSCSDKGPTPWYVNRRLKALVLLPSRELVIQVHDVFDKLCKGLDVRVALVTGQNSFDLEQKMLLGVYAPHPHPTTSGGVASIAEHFSNEYLYSSASHAAGRSHIDVLVCTSGRLLDHLQFTEGFTLQHLRFLVLDEADRLLGNAYHGWVRLLIQSINATEQSMNTCMSKASNESSVLNSDLAFCDRHDESNKRRKAQHNSGTQSQLEAILQYQSLRPPLQRLLFSATLTDNPSKLALLGIYSPLLIQSSRCSKAPDPIDTDGSTHDGADDSSTAVAEASRPNSADDVTMTGGYYLPEGLTESSMMVASEDRPVVLMSIILEALGHRSGGSRSDGDADATSHGPLKASAGRSKHQHRNICGDQRSGSMCIVFTSSVEETHRLCKLLQIMNDLSATGTATGGGDRLFDGRVEEMSRSVRQEDRVRIMQQCRDGDVSVLISSDHMARGIDLTNIRLVVNYEPPKHARTYVHRVGRTARAGQAGHAITLVSVGQLGDDQ